MKQIESILLERVEIGGRLKSANPVSFRLGIENYITFHLNVIL